MNPVTKSIVVNRKVAACYALWSDFDSLPYFMKYIRSVARTDELTSHWVMSGPLDVNVEWDAIITNKVRNEMISWKSTGGDVETWGQVAFTAMSPTETLVTTTVHYAVPYGKAGEWLAKIFHDPDRVVEQDLENFKKYAEAKTAVGSGGSL